MEACALQREQPLLTATRESPRAAVKTPEQPKINRKNVKAQKQNKKPSPTRLDDKEKMLLCIMHNKWSQGRAGG